MLLTLTPTRESATDLGYLLHGGRVLTDVGGEGMASGSADACRASAVISRADLSVLIRTRHAFVSLVLRLERLRFANRCSILRRGNNQRDDADHTQHPNVPYRSDVSRGDVAVLASRR